jgi:hypothetical protein
VASTEVKGTQPTLGHDESQLGTRTGRGGTGLHIGSVIQVMLGSSDQVMEIACGLHNLRVCSRHLLPAFDLLRLISSG